MPKLNQIIAVCNGKKSRAQSALTVIHHKVQKKELMTGLSRTYFPKDEDGEKLPPESKRVQYTVAEAITEVKETLTDLFDTVATQDSANCVAKADVIVDNVTILKQVPVTYLLFLEKQLVDIHTFVDKLPTLDPAYEWNWNSSSASYSTPARESIKTKKTKKHFVAYEATKEHPAQVAVYDEDVPVGTWSVVDFSGAIPETTRRKLLEKVEQLQDAVKAAREAANSLEVESVRSAEAIFNFLFA